MKTPTLNIKRRIRTRTCINNCSQLKCVLFVRFGFACFSKCSVRMCAGSYDDKKVGWRCWTTALLVDSTRCHHFELTLSTNKCNSISISFACMQTMRVHMICIALWMQQQQRRDSNATKRFDSMQKAKCDTLAIGSKFMSHCAERNQNARGTRFQNICDSKMCFEIVGILIASGTPLVVTAPRTLRVCSWRWRWRWWSCSQKDVKMNEHEHCGGDAMSVCWLQ